MIALGVGIFLLVLTIKLLYDLNEWKYERPTNHPVEWAISAFPLITAAIILADDATHYWITLGTSLSLVAIWMWTLFDGLYNVLRGQKWNFTGTVDEDDAWWDKLQRKYPWIWKAKIVLSIVFLITYVILIKNQ